jgi:hypothetical protein
MRRQAAGAEDEATALPVMLDAVVEDDATATAVNGAWTCVPSGLKSFLQSLDADDAASSKDGSQEEPTLLKRFAKTDTPSFFPFGPESGVRAKSGSM